MRLIMREVRREGKQNKNKKAKLTKESVVPPLPIMHFEIYMFSSCLIIIMLRNAVHWSSSFFFLWFDCTTKKKKASQWIIFLFIKVIIIIVILPSLSLFYDVILCVPRATLSHNCKAIRLTTSSAVFPE